MTHPDRAPDTLTALDAIGRHLRRIRSALVLARLAHDALIEEADLGEDRRTELDEAAELAIEAAAEHAKVADEAHFRLDIAIRQPATSPAS
jgi:hypothetical protein